MSQGVSGNEGTILLSTKWVTKGGFPNRPYDVRLVDSLIIQAR